MATVMRRTPQSEEASAYGYRDLLKEIIGRTISETTAGFKRPTDFSDEEIMQMAFAGVGGGTKILKEAAGGGKLLELLTKGVSKEGKWKMPITKPHLATAEEIPKWTTPMLEKYKKEGLTYDAYMNLIPDKPEFAYHQWTFRGKGPLARATVTTKGTSLDEFEAMVADRIKKFAKPMITAND